MAFHPVIVNRIRAMAGVDYWKKDVEGKITIAVDNVWFDVVAVLEAVGGYDTVELRFTPIPNPYPAS
jgi:hypothetical protein